MTDKQIIEPKNGFYCIEPCSEIKQLKEQLKAKEQECEKAKQNAQDTYDLWQALIESFNILQGEKIKLEQECEELKAERDSWHYQWEKRYEIGECLSDKIDQLKQTLAEIKELAESEMDSKEFMAVQCVLNGSVDNKNKVLKQIIQKINEVIDE